MRVRFRQDYRGHLTDENYYLSGAEADFPPGVAEALAAAGRAEIVEDDMAWTANRRLFWTADQSRVVEEGDPEASTLFRATGQSISENDMQRYNISREKAHPGPTENKLAGPPGANKSGDDLAATSGLGDDRRLLALLAAHGITRKSQVQALSDEELRAIDGIGPAMLRKLREATA